MNTRTLILIAIAGTLASCVSVPEHNSALNQARDRFNAAQNDRQVATLAPVELKQAGTSLALAEQAAIDHAPTSTINHLAYITAQRVTIAQETASSKASQAITANAAGERDRMLLAMRTHEADQAQQRLVAADAAAIGEKARYDAQISDLETQLKDLDAKKTNRGMIVTLGDVLFDTGKSQMKAAATNNLAKLAAFFKENPERTASVEGYTDDVGSASSNYDLSQRRAMSVMAALISLGVPADRLNTMAHGEEMPAADNATAAGRQMNRRVEIVFAPRNVDVSMQ